MDVHQTLRFAFLNVDCLNGKTLLIQEKKHLSYSDIYLSRMLKSVDEFLTEYNFNIF